MDASYFLISVLNGLSVGLLLFMLASGLTLIFSMMGVLNFAHASFYMVGAYVAYSITQVVGFWWGLVLAPPIVGLVGAAFGDAGHRRHLLWIADPVAGAADEPGRDTPHALHRVPRTQGHRKLRQRHVHCAEWDVLQQHHRATNRVPAG
jgi:hypothetical protein